MRLGWTGAWRNPFQTPLRSQYALATMSSFTHFIHTNIFHFFSPLPRHPTPHHPHPTTLAFKG